MNLLDMRTLMLGYAITNFVCMIVVAVLWRQNRGRFPGIGYWLGDFVLQFAAMVLIALRGVLPALLSMSGSNALVIGGAILGYIGLQRFVGKPGSQLPNYALLAAFVLAHVYFVLVVPSLAVRSELVTAALLAVCAQCAWLMLRRVDRGFRVFTNGVGLVFVGFCAVSIVRLVVDLAVPPDNDFFHSNVYDSSLLVAYEVLTIFLAFSLFLMVNRRLFVELENDIGVRRQVEAALRTSEEKFSKAFRSGPDAVLISRLRDGHFIEVNEGFSRLTGYSREEALASSSIALNLWHDQGARENIVAKLRAEGRVQDHEVDFRVKSGAVVNCLYFGEIIALGDEEHILSMVRDVSERKRAESIIQTRLKLFEFASTHSTKELMQEALDVIETLTGSLIGFYHFVEEDQNTLTLQAWSTRTKGEFCKAEGEDRHYPIAEAGVWVDCVRAGKAVIHNDYASLPHRKGMPEGHAEVVRELVVPTMRGGRIVSILGVGNKTEDYDERDVEIVSYVADVVWSIVRQKREEEEIRRLNGELQRLAMTDELTGLANRRSFAIEAGKEIKRSRRYGTPLTLIALDVDKFKDVNDAYGHEAGDVVLREIAGTLQGRCRDVDLVARLGGEEFGILLPSTTAEEGAKVAEGLRSAIETDCRPAKGRTSVTASFGVAEYDQERDDLDSLMRSADAAMYVAKGLGRNRVVVQGGASGS